MWMAGQDCVAAVTRAWVIAMLFLLASTVQGELGRRKYRVMEHTQPHGV